MTIRPIIENDNAAISKIIRDNLEKYGLNIEGTAYFDPELDNLSSFYAKNPKERHYMILTDSNGSVCGGIGFAKFDAIEDCAEIQKLYVKDCEKGKGLGKLLLNKAEKEAKIFGYKRLYLETHSFLKEATSLYEKEGFKQIEKPPFVFHSFMDMFFTKEL